MNKTMRKTQLKDTSLGMNSEQTLKKGKFFMWFELASLKT